MGSKISSTSADVALAHGRMRQVWISSLSSQLKAKIFRATIEPILHYGCETWALTKTLDRKLSATWFKLIRWALNIHWKTRRTNESILLEFKLPHPDIIIQRRFLRFLGHSIRECNRESSYTEKSPLSKVILLSAELTNTRK